MLEQIIIENTEPDAEPDKCQCVIHCQTRTCLNGFLSSRQTRFSVVAGPHTPMSHKLSSPTTLGMTLPRSEAAQTVIFRVACHAPKSSTLCHYTSQPVPRTLLPFPPSSRHTLRCRKEISLSTALKSTGNSSSMQSLGYICEPISATERCNQGLEFLVAIHPPYSSPP